MMDTEDSLTSPAAEAVGTQERRRGDRRRRQIAIFVDRRAGDRRRTPGLEALMRILFGRKS